MSRRPGRAILVAALLLAGAVPGCARPEPDDALPHDAFLDSLALHCGRAYEGTVTTRPPEDEIFRGDETLTVHFRECAPGRLALPFHVEDDRSRTWILTRTDSGLDLRHDHRHEDGTPAETTMYGAHTVESGTARRQDFLRPLRDDVRSGWAIEVVPHERYTYGTTVDGEWRYRLDFDLTAPVEPPPAPWGHD